MAQAVSFEITGLKELRKSLEAVQRRYPQETATELYRLAGLFTKDVNANMDFAHGTGATLKKSWHRKRQKYNGTLEGVEIWNDARKFHLLENGHEVRLDRQHFAAYKAGKLDSSKRTRKHRRGKKNPRLTNAGFAPGLHFTAKTRDEWRFKFNTYLSAFIDKMLKAENL